MEDAAAAVDDDVDAGLLAGQDMNSDGDDAVYCCCLLMFAFCLYLQYVKML